MRRRISESETCNTHTARSDGILGHKAYAPENESCRLYRYACLLSGAWRALVQVMGQEVATARGRHLIAEARALPILAHPLHCRHPECARANGQLSLISAVALGPRTAAIGVTDATEGAHP